MTPSLCRRLYTSLTGEAKLRLSWAPRLEGSRGVMMVTACSALLRYQRLSSGKAVEKGQLQ